MARLFYLCVYVSTLAVLAALWTQRDDRGTWLDAISVSRASAQSPDNMSGYGGWSPQGLGPGGVTPMGMGPMGMGSSGAGGNPALSAQSPLTPMPVENPQAVSRPAGWPSASPVTAPTTSAQGAGSSMFGPPRLPASFPQTQSSLPGTSISQVPPEAWKAPNPAQPAAAPMGASAPMGTTAPPGYVVPVSASAAPAPTAILEAPISEFAPSYSEGEAPAAAAQPPISQLGDAKVIARVGSEVILAGEILGPIDELLATQAKGAPEDEVEKVRDMLVRKRLDQAIQTKLIVGEARRKVGDGWKNIEAKCGEMFEEMEVPKALKRMDCHTREELDAKLREVGNSVDREKRLFTERNVAQDWVRQQAKVEKEIAHEQLLAYYLEHATEYDFETKVRWEQLMVRFASYPSKAEAYRAIAAAGNRVIGGEQFGEVARAVSEGPTANFGGVHDWTTEGSMTSDGLNQALVDLPVGQMSGIIEDNRGFHIIRVTERVMAGRTPFPDVQAQIKQKLKQERTERLIHQYVEKLQTSTKIWTIFDGPTDSQVIPGAGFYTTPAEAGLPATVPQRPQRPLETATPVLGPRYQ